MTGWHLEEIEIEGFRGINNEGDPFLLKFKTDKVNSISATNGIGKSSIFDAVTYALSGKIPKLDNLPATENGQNYYNNRFHSLGEGSVKLKLVPANGGAAIEIKIVRNANGQRLISGTPIILDAENGYFVIKPSSDDCSGCADCTDSLGISTVDIVMNAGYQSGVAMNSPTLQLAMCMAADIAMKMMYDEGIGVIYENMIRTQQVGRVIQSFETKGFFTQTLFGPSSRANYILNLLRPYMIVRAGRLG